jgi:hypothetical protein
MAPRGSPDAAAGGAEEAARGLQGRMAEVRQLQQGRRGGEAMESSSAEERGDAEEGRQRQWQ